MNPTFIRATQADDKEAILRSAVQALKSGSSAPEVFQVDPRAFTKVPSAPFAYWVSDAIRDLFTTLPPLKSEGRAAAVGLQTSDDFRFLRAWWEVPPETLNHRWFPFAKGGPYSPFYADIYLVVNWESNGKEMKAWADPLYGNSGWSRIIKGTEYFFRPGVFQTLRASRLAPHITPSGCLFGHNGFQAFSVIDDLLSLVGLLNSKPFQQLIRMLLGRWGYSLYVSGAANSLPFPILSDTDKAKVGEIALKLWSLYRANNTTSEVTHIFNRPALLEVSGETVHHRIVAHVQKAAESETRIQLLHAELDQLVYNLLGVGQEDVEALSTHDSVESTDGLDTEDALDEAGSNNAQSSSHDVAIDLVAWLFGASIGRFRAVLNPQTEHQDPMYEIPKSSPAMQGAVALCFLVDDQTQSRSPLVAGFSGLLSAMNWVSSDLVLGELADALGYQSVEAYIRRPSGFFSDHLSMYSLSQRKAPIYWPLSTASGQYTVWLYAPVLNSQTLFTLVLDHVNPKIEQTELRLGQVQARLDAGATPNLRDELAAVKGLLDELTNFRDGLLKVTELPYRPNLDDGIVITAAPLAEFFLHPKWKADLQACWKKLQEGDYDWAHLAFAIWPDRVTEKCRHDRSLAIAHDLEALCEVPEVVPKAPHAKKTTKEGQP